MYFRLNPECYFIRGNRCGAIFDLIDTKIYALNQQETEVVTSCEKNNPVQGGENLLKELKQFRLGNFYPNRVYIQKLRVGSFIEEKQKDQPPELYRAFLEINNLCNRDCWFCGYYGIKRSLGCMGCNIWNENGKPLTIDRWKRLIDELKDLECMNLFITGGDLTLAWNKTMDILDYAHKKFDNIYVILHQQSLSERVMNDLANKAKVIIQTENSNCAPSEDSIFLLIVKPDDWRSTNSIIDKNMMIDFVIEDMEFLSNDLPIISKRKITSVNMYRFLNNMKYHPCIGNTLAICYNGNVLPCPMMRDHSIGNVRNRGLYTIFENEWEQINMFWNLTLDKIEKCGGCEFRYACNDCRALEEELTGKLDGKRMCSYDPKEGKWL